MTLTWVRDAKKVCGAAVHCQGGLGRAGSVGKTLELRKDNSQPGSALTPVEAWAGLIGPSNLSLELCQPTLTRDELPFAA